jgi:hypothetical protein
VKQHENRVTDFIKLDGGEYLAVFAQSKNCGGREAAVAR